MASKGEIQGTEKTDGYNVFIGYVDGQPKAARNNFFCMDVYTIRQVHYGSPFGGTSSCSVPSSGP